MTAREGRGRIVVLGGGFAGLAAALELESLNHEVTLVDRHRTFEFLPNIHELVSGVKSPAHVRLPLDRIVRRVGHRFVRGVVTGLDPKARIVSVEGRKIPLGYDALVVAFGGVDSDRGVDGVFEHAIGFKSAADCDRIGRRLAQLARRRRSARVVIVGGGLEGIEALGEILRRHRRSTLHTTLVEGADRLLPEAPPAIDAHLRKICAPYGVDLRTGALARSIEPDAVELRDGSRLPSELTIWTGGVAPPGLLSACGLAPEGGWAPVDQTLQSSLQPEVFVAGDAAVLPEALPKQAYHALDMGRQAARNASRTLLGRRRERFRPSPKPMLVSFGDLNCFLVLGDRVIAGPALGAGKEAVFELTMAQLDAEPVPDQIGRIAGRAARAGRALLWPSLSSPRAWHRQGRLTVLPEAPAGR